MMRTLFNTPLYSCLLPHNSVLLFSALGSAIPISSTDRKPTKRLNLDKDTASSAITSTISIDRKSNNNHFCDFVWETVNGAEKKHTNIYELSSKLNEDVMPQVLHAPNSPSLLNLAQLMRHDLDHGSGIAAAFCNAADALITSLLSPAHLKPSVDPHVQLAGNCAPVSESPPTVCSIIGSLPSDLTGVYVRNGPNAVHLHQGEGCHLFDGDGMLHCVKFDHGKTTFCARHVKTSGFQQEQAVGRPLFPKIFGGLSGIPGFARATVCLMRAGLGALDLSQGWGLSNTSIIFFNGQMLSMSEDDMPYVVKVTDSGDLLTTGRFRLPGRFNMCAHPKIDPLTGKMFSFSFSPTSWPPFSFFSVAKDGTKSLDIPVPLFDVPLLHDFAITKRYVIFPDNQLVVRPMEVLRGGSALVSDTQKTPRFCLLPQSVLPEDAAKRAQWFDAPGCNCIHYVNAWEEGSDEVVLVAPVLTSSENILDFPAVNTVCTLSEIRLNTVTGKVTCQQLCSGNFEFGTLNQKYIGQRTRYVYLASGCYPHLSGVVKVDLQAGASDAVVGRRMFGEGCSGGEPFFVPRKTKWPAHEKELAEDDGYLMCYVYSEQRGVSELLVMDACSPSLDVIAVVQLPSRVPVGFHGCFVSQEQLAKQVD